MYLVRFRASASFIRPPHGGALLILAGSANQLIVEVPDDVKVVEDRLDPLTAFLKGLMEVRVHVTGNSLDALHPVHADMLYEVIDHLLPLAMGDPENVSGLHINDVGRVPAAVVKFEPIDAKVLSLTLRLDQLRSVDGVFVPEALLIYGPDCVLVEAGEFCHLLLRVGSPGQKFNRVLMKAFGDHMTVSFER